MSRRKKRVVYRVQWKRCPRAIAEADGKPVTAEKGWALSCGGEGLVWGMSFRETVAEGRERARAGFAVGNLAQVVIHGKDGRFRFENTYGADPKRSRG